MLLSACEFIEDNTDEERIISRTSSIIPPKLLIENTTLISLVSPANGEAYYIDERNKSDLIFEFEDSNAKYSALFIFNQVPESSDGIISNGLLACLGGVTNMTSDHNWHSSQLRLSVDAASSHIFTCNGSNPIDIFSTVNKLPLEETTLPKNSAIYWAILGYDAHYQITHSSNVRKINIK